jgi:hypothetical protein
VAEIETDYLIIGAGAVGMAFADTLLDEDPDCHITIIDQHAKPGGHWNDAYSFVTLHQPSSTYGVNSAELSSGIASTQGHNKGMAPLATHAEILAYYEQVMNQKMLASGRVRFLPLTRYLGGQESNHQCEAILSGEKIAIKLARKLVDGTYFRPASPPLIRPVLPLTRTCAFQRRGNCRKSGKMQATLQQIS